MAIFSIKPELPNRSEIIRRMKRIEGPRPKDSQVVAMIMEDSDTLWDELIEERRAHEESRRRMQALTGWIVWMCIFAFLCGAFVVWGVR